MPAVAVPARPGGYTAAMRPYRQHIVSPTVLLALCLWAAAAEAQQQSGSAGDESTAAAGLPLQVPVEDLSADAGSAAPAGAENPAAQCYFAARGDAIGDDATFACDLAVRMARDAAAGGGGNTSVIAALTNRALVLADTGRLEPALEDLDAALALAPDDVRLHGNRGNLLLRLGRLQDALAAHDRAVTLAPRNPETYYNRAFVYRALGEPGLAAEDVARARQLLGRVSAADTREPAGGRGR